MKIIRESLFEGAKRARGTAIVVDVFRAFTATPLFFSLRWTSTFGRAAAYSRRMSIVPSVDASSITTIWHTSTDWSRAVCSAALTVSSALWVVSPIVMELSVMRVATEPALRATVDLARRVEQIL